MATSTIESLAGVDFTALEAVPQFALGTRKQDSNGTTWMYVKASASGQTAKLVYQILTTYTLAAAAVGYHATVNVRALGVPAQAMTANLYGWVQIQGPMVIATTAAVTAGVKCYTTATAGKISGTSTTQNEILGLSVITDPGAAGDASCFAIQELRS